MKVVDVAEFYADRGGGVRTYVHRKLEAASARGVEQVIIAPGPRDRVEERHGGRIVWVKSPVLPLDRRYRVFMGIEAAHEVLHAERPDVIEASSPWAGARIVGAYRSWAPKVMIFHQDPIAVYPHTLLDRFVTHETLDDACEPYWRYLRRLASKFDATLVSGHWLAERLRQRRVPGVRTLPFGIDKDTFDPGKRDNAIRRSWFRRAGAPDDAHLLLAIGRHHPEKRLGTLIEAVRQLEAEGVGGRPVALVIFGDGPLRAWVDHRARRARHVVVAGTTHDRSVLAAALASGDAFVHGSAAETYGLVVAEALCSGLPLVVPDAGGAADLADAAYAETYRAGDATQCAAAIRRVLMRPHGSLRSAARQLGRARVLDADAHFERLFALYAELAKRRSAA